jgi:dihydrofolate synthase/folylpolyglutamate synthase
MSDLLLPHDAALERLRALHPIKIDLTLGRTLRLLDDLGRPQDRLPPVIHVAGTNGKGSTIAFLRAIAEAAGLRTHVFTSPHLVRFAERIRLSGTLISDNQLDEVILHVERVNAGQPITFFEITTVAAIEAFAGVPADLCIIEVGLGGRFDSTNVIDRPAVSVIAPVDIDHKEYLGDTLSQIAGEKAGIIKAGRPVVSARQADEALQVIEAEAEWLGAPLILSGRDYDAHGERGGMVFQALGEALGDRLYDLPPPSLIGAHQIDNAGTAIAAALALGDPRIDEAAIARGLTTATWPARMQRLNKGPLGVTAEVRGADLWLDGGHNPHAARALAEAARAMRARDGRPVTLIIGLLQRKDAAGVFDAFRDLGARLIATGFSSELAAPPESLAATAPGLKVEIARNPAEALALALNGNGAEDRPPPHIILCGSLYMAGEVLAMSRETWPT